MKFDIDANGILTVSSKDKATGKSQSITITGSSGLSDEEIKRMIEDAEAHKAEDAARKATVDARNSLDAIIVQAEKFIKENETVDTSDLKDDVEAGKSVLKDNPDDTDALKSAAEKITKTFQEVSKKMYEEKAQNEQSGEATAHTEDVEDAEIIDATVE